MSSDISNMSNEDIIEELRKIVKSKGLKYTQQREIILSILISEKDHLTAEDIYNNFKTSYPDQTIGIATVEVDNSDYTAGRTETQSVVSLGISF